MTDEEFFARIEIRLTDRLPIWWNDLSESEREKFWAILSEVRGIEREVFNNEYIRIRPDIHPVCYC